MATDTIDRIADIPRVELDEEKFQYPGIPTTCDGAEAVVWVETRISQGSGAFPITSSTTMGGGFNQAVANGTPNLWGEQLVFVEPESEHSAASFCEGFAAAGGRVTNFTSGQGLILMKEVLYTISGKRLPVVMNIGARALTSQGLNVHAGHDDVMSVADCGWGMLFGRNAQETGDLCLISRRAAEDSHTPFFNVQDGFFMFKMPENCTPSALAEIATYLKPKLTEAVDAGHNRAVINCEALKSLHMGVIKQLVSAMQLCKDTGVNYALVGNSQLTTECKGFEETRAWNFHETLAEAKASFVKHAPAAAPAPALATA